MNIEKARFNMIEQQIRPWDVLAPDVLDLLLVVKRENFVPPAYRNLAFMDTEIPLSASARMFTPKLEARILQELNVRPQETVLEIGAGSGYLAALLAAKARQVTTVEIDPALAAMARKNLADNGVRNVEVVEGNGAAGWPANRAEPLYDVIVISASVHAVPDIFLKQLKPGGRLFVVVGEPPVMSAEITTRAGDSKFETVKVFETSIAPLLGIAPPSQFSF
ncbi:protein-L-isoaspartate O-methyltransferase family protein [Noviherbaspirillum aridicola]|uniref:Protein-L-isoaspartate O-methyltransferase n=1 Tax=Noviherbaspirillum aridicola TaxID=2849687 RepID=A0ABQ4Q8Z9_9BURK|nr:protein-L-isoaspartate O-methyltransferase [Noviherbaspirillum aridicola]GIZ53260.1 protein-L-isoaspartate O-methyltransferase [Noviherbaspirillum aridicola]